MTDKTKKSKKKIVSVKKLSRFYKKTYTTDSFEKKILQKLFIESDKNLISKLFIPSLPIELQIISFYFEYFMDYLHPNYSLKH